LLIQPLADDSWGEPSLWPRLSAQRERGHFMTS
jgi:hypothetical protein